MIGHPAFYFIKYLLLTLDDPSRDTLNDTLDLYGLAPIRSEQYERAKSLLGEPPASFRPLDSTHRPSVSWLKEQRIYSLIHRDVISTAVLDYVVRQSRVRVIVERMLLGRVPADEIQGRLRSLGIRKVTAEVVTEFRHYFWDVDSMSVGDWAHYFEFEPGKGRTSRLSDDYMFALNGGRELALYREGIAVELDTQEVIQEIFNELAMTFREVKSLPLSGAKVDMLSTLTRNILKVDERFRHSDIALADVLEKFEKFRVTHEEDTVPALSALAPTGTSSDRSSVKDRAKLK